MIHAVVDIGSNTATLAVFRLDGGTIDRLAQDGEPLRLMRRLAPDGTFPPSAIERTSQVMRTFARRASELGAESIDAIATSAVRDARNQEALLTAIRDAGVPVRLISGEEEAGLAVRAALGTLPVTDGFVVDLGGGSLQIARIRRRRATQVVSLPLGGLRLADGFLESNPPTGPEMTRLRRHATAALRHVEWLRAEPGDVLVGMGGSVRAMGKVDRRERRWPILHDHGYRLDEDALLASLEHLSRLDAKARELVPGLAAHRVDTIVPALVVIHALLRVLGLDELRISTASVREGLALQRNGALRPTREVRIGALRRHLPGIPPAAARAIAEAEPHAAALLLARHLDRAHAANVVQVPLHGFWQEELLPAASAGGFG